MEKKAYNYWKHIADNNPTELTAKVNPRNDYTQLDADFIMKYANSETTILDLASSTGMTINKYFHKVKHIEAVELFPEFTKFIVRTDKISIVNCDIKDYQTTKKFDIIVMFGIIQYFSVDEMDLLYSKYRNFLKDNGLLLIKNQFGIYEDVIVSGYSEELKTDYFSHYRYLEKEKNIINRNKFKITDVIDIYPPECNRWKDTHFYAIVAKKS